MDCRERSSNKSSRSVGRWEILAGVGHVVALSNAERGVGDGIWMVEVLELARRLQPNFNVGYQIARDFSMAIVTSAET